MFTPVHLMVDNGGNILHYFVFEKTSEEEHKGFGAAINAKQQFQAANSEYHVAVSGKEKK